MAEHVTSDPVCEHFGCGPMIQQSSGRQCTICRPQPAPEPLPELDEYDVAVVVYCRAQGVGPGDAQNRAERAVLDDLLDQHGGGLPMHLTDQVTVAGFSGLSHAHVVLRPDATAYKRVGMTAPRKAADGG